MKVALCQMNIIWEDKATNQLKVIQYIKEAAQQAVDLIVFPEMCLTGFSMNIKKIMEENGETVTFFSQLAKQFNIFIGFGWVKAARNGKKAENHFTIVTPTEDVLSDYIKIHPFSFAKEDKDFLGGQKIVYFKIKEFLASTFICYDLRFPEVFQTASHSGELIIVAANWPEKRSEHWKCLMKARAIENQVYLLGVNCVGRVNDISYSGDSCVIDPNGNIKAELVDEEGLIICEIENDVDSYRKDFPVKQDRKHSLYRKFYI